MNKTEILKEYQSFVDSGKSDEQLIADYAKVYIPTKGNLLVVKPRLNKYTLSGIEIMSGKMLEELQNKSFLKGNLIIGATEENANMIGKRCVISKGTQYGVLPLDHTEADIPENNRYYGFIMSVHSAIAFVDTKYVQSDITL